MAVLHPAAWRTSLLTSCTLWSFSRAIEINHRNSEFPLNMPDLSIAFCKGWPEAKSHKTTIFLWVFPIGSKRRPFDRASPNGFKENILLRQGDRFPKAWKTPKWRNFRGKMYGKHAPYGKCMVNIWSIYYHRQNILHVNRLLISHMLHVWKICLHLPQKSTKCR